MLIYQRVKPCKTNLVKYRNFCMQGLWRITHQQCQQFICNLEDESTCWQHCITGFLKVSSMCWRVRLCSDVCCCFLPMSTRVVSPENRPKLIHLKWFMWSLLNGGLILQSHLFHTCSLLKFHFWDINSKLLINGIWASQPWIPVSGISTISGISSGKRLHNYGKSPCYVAGKIHYFYGHGFNSKLLVYQAG